MNNTVWIYYLIKLIACFQSATTPFDFQYICEINLNIQLKISDDYRFDVLPELHNNRIDRKWLGISEEINIQCENI